MQSVVARLKKARQVLITGRLASVQSARAAVKLARVLNATIDCSEKGWSFDNVLALQHSGMISSSLGEIRDHADRIILVGDERWWEAFPNFARYTGTGGDLSAPPKRVLMLGSGSDESILPWVEAGCEAVAIPIAANSIPAWLYQTCAKNAVSEAAFDLRSWLSESNYCSIIWHTPFLGLEHADLWVESMLHWIALQNETKRCTALPWSGFDGTFLQVCTWLTGFPGRVRFVNGEPFYDPRSNSYESWIGRLKSKDLNPNDCVVLCLDETISSIEFAVDLPEQNILRLGGPAGAEGACDTFRGDQTILAHLEPELGLAGNDPTRGAHAGLPLASILERLVELC